MHFIHETARSAKKTAGDRLAEVFGKDVCVCLSDAVYKDRFRQEAFGVTGLPYRTPIAGVLLESPEIALKIGHIKGSVLLNVGDGNELHMMGAGGEIPLTAVEHSTISDTIGRILEGPGHLNDKGELVLDLKAVPVGPHYPVNLLLGDRRHDIYPLVTTPKSAVDAFGHGSFRSVGGDQVLATRCVLDLNQNGEPANRQFYLFENGKQIFYSADVNHNVKTAQCLHSRNRTVISYETEDGLDISRTIFLMPQKEGLPNAVEVQRILIKNTTSDLKKLKIVMTGVFGIADANTIANDDVYANIVQESEILSDGGKGVAISLHPKPQEEQSKKRFAMLLENGQPMDDFCTSEDELVGNGTLMRPENCGVLSNRLSRKNASFFAMGKTLTIEPGETAEINELTGMVNRVADKNLGADEAIWNLYQFAGRKGAVEEELSEVEAFWNRYPQYLTPTTSDKRFNAYVGYNLPFQVLYQTYVSRAFAWTQKSYRETGFREIQDIYASMYYLSAIGENELIKDLLGSWICQVYRMGYANHDFTFTGKEPGDCSDDQLWLVQAVYRYVKLTGDKEFLKEKYPVAGTENQKRSLWETIMAILTYSGCISVGRHGLPLLDKADWNDTLKLDRIVLKGPAKEAAYRKQLLEKHQSYGTPWENTLTESTMNACLLKIAADEASELGRMIGETEGTEKAEKIAEKTADAMQRYAWKENYFARCLINDRREGGYTYLGARGDGLSMDPEVDGSYFLNSYSWSILSGIATEDQVARMFSVVNKYLKTDAGLRLCTLIDYDRLGVQTGTALYFPGDRENSGVFKHAAMMATVASLKAAKTVKDESLARDLAELAWFMIDRTLPYKTMDNPYVLKGNPRFCTQYNNSETGENIGPMLSGTASWLTLAMYEIFGVTAEKETIRVNPVLRPGMTGLSCDMRIRKALWHIQIHSENDAIRSGASTVYSVDGRKVRDGIIKESSGEHLIEVTLR